MTKFKNYTTFINISESEEYFTIEDIQEMLSELMPEEIQEVGECIADLICSDFEDCDDIDDIDDIDEVHYFDKKNNQVKRDKKKNKSQRRKDAKKRKQWYKKNKSKVKRKNKKYRKKVKRQPNMVTKHR
jgi:hypothetical protein